MILKCFCRIHLFTWQALLRIKDAQLLNVTHLQTTQKGNIFALKKDKTLAAWACNHVSSLSGDVDVNAGGDTRHQRPPLRAAGDTILSLINYAHSGSTSQHYQKRAIPRLPKINWDWRVATGGGTAFQEPAERSYYESGIKCRIAATVYCEAGIRRVLGYPSSYTASLILTVIKLTALL